MKQSESTIRQIIDDICIKLEDLHDVHQYSSKEVFHARNWLIRKIMRDGEDDELKVWMVDFLDHVANLLERKEKKTVNPDRNKEEST